MASYYVDATLGDDGNPGTQTQPWKTISRVNSSSFSPGDSIYFKRGEIWRETLIIPSSGTEGSPITFGAYGSGDKPKISAFDLITDSWIGPDANGEFYVPETTIVYVLLKDGINLLRGTVGSLNAEEWGYDSGNGRIYYKPTSGSPSGTFEKCIRETACTVNSKNYVTFDNLHFEGQNTNWNNAKGCFDCVGSDHVTVQNCYAYFGRGYGICFRDNCSNVTVDNCTTYRNGARGITIAQTNTATVKNCRTYQNGKDHYLLTDDMEGIAITGNCSGNIVIENCMSYENGRLDNTNGNKGKGIDIHSCTGTVVVRWNRIYDNAQRGLSIINSTGKIDIYYNLIYHNGIGTENIDNRWGGIFLGYPSASNTDGISICNNTIWKNDGRNDVHADQSANLQLVVGTGCSVSLVVKNNIIGEFIQSQPGYDIVYRGVGTFNITSDYNCIYRSDDKNMIFYRGSVYTQPQFSSYQNEKSQDQHSISQDPLFVDADHYDFHLQPSSPCIDAGVDVGLDRDFDYNPVPWGAGVDIGAFELIRRITVLSLSYHPLDVRSGKWIDLSRKGNHGVPYGGARPVMIAPGVMGFEFDGVSGYVGVPHNDSLDITDEITVEAWVKPFSIMKYVIFVFKGKQANNYACNCRFLEGNKAGAMIRKGGSYYSITGDTVWTTNKWYHIVFTYDGSQMRWFLNGVEDTSPVSLTGKIDSVTESLKIGGYGEASYAFNGIIDGVRIYDRTLSEAEIRENIYRSPIYRMLRGLPHSMIYTKVPWKQTQGGIYVP